MIIEHDLLIYPRRIWVVKDESFDHIKKDFSLREEDEKMTDEEIEENWDAFVISCQKNKYHGFMVFINGDCEDKTLVHEALHVALNVYEECSITLEAGMDQEPLCYLVEYIYKLLKEDVK